MSSQNSTNEEILLTSPYVILDQLEQQLVENEKLITKVSELESEIQQLKTQLAKYQSPNIPSSKQLFPKKKEIRSGLPRSYEKKKRGGSKKGKTSPIWDQKEPDVVKHSYVDKCQKCNKPVNIEDQVFSHSKRILELPEVIDIRLEEHHIHEYECDCGGITRAEEPTIEGTSLGPNLLTLVTTMRYRTGASFENIAQLLYDHTNKKLSLTAINRGFGKLCESLKPESDEIASEVINSKYTQFDETGHKLVLEGKASQKGSKKIWVWVAAIANAAYYHVDLSRSKKALEKMLKFRDPEKPPMISVSDALPAYLNSFEIKQFCWAHLLRASKELEDKCENARIIHKRLSELYIQLKSLQKKLQLKNKPASDKLHKKILEELLNIVADPSCENTEKIVKHIKWRAEQYITVLKYPELPMTNNHAERLLKSVIVHRSNGKPLRSIAAMEQYGIILTVLTTWKLRGKPIASSLREWIDKQIGQPKLIK